MPWTRFLLAEEQVHPLHHGCKEEKGATLPPSPPWASSESQGNAELERFWDVKPPFHLDQETGRFNPRGLKRAKR